MSKSKEFARYIRAAYPNVKITLRGVLLKDITDTDAELDALAAFAHELGGVFHAVELIPYHELGREKYASLEFAYPLDDMCAYRAEDAVQVRDRLEKAGLSTILSIV